jgi:hypothetical protein
MGQTIQPQRQAKVWAQIDASKARLTEREKGYNVNLNMHEISILLDVTDYYDKRLGLPDDAKALTERLHEEYVKYFPF